MYCEEHGAAKVIEGIVDRVNKTIWSLHRCLPLIDLHTT